MENLFILLRIAGVTGVLVFVPGYVVSLVLLPQRAGLDFVQRLAFGGSLGLVMTVVIGTLLIESGLGFHLSTYLLMLLSVTLLFGVVAWMRSKKNAAPERAPVGQVLSKFVPTKKQGALWASVLGMMIVLTILLLPSPKPSQFEQYTEFYVLDTTAEIPYYLAVPRDQTIVLNAGIISHEYVGTTYQILVAMEEEILFFSHPISLAYEERWEGELAVHIPSVNTNQSFLLELFLLREGSTEPYRRLHLWIGDSS